jgi:predicted SAM-dependent methyltransferase
VSALSERRVLLRRFGRGPAGLRRPPFIRRREGIAKRYIAGSGIEIGGLNAPLRVPGAARVRYVDRARVAELRKQYPELNGQPLVETDIVDDGERLVTIPDASEDFVIANHFLEHCQDPIGALRSMFRVLAPEGILYLAVPDKRFTFDHERPVTTAEHLLEHAEKGPEIHRREHYEEWVRLVDGVSDQREIARRVEELMDRNYSIHYHVWTQAEVFELLLLLRSQLDAGFDIEIAVRNGHENIFVLRKSPPSPPPGSAPTA